MSLRDELLASPVPNTHIADICGRAADELLIKEMKIEQQEREIDRLRAEIRRIRIEADEQDHMSGGAI